MVLTGMQNVVAYLSLQSHQYTVQSDESGVEGVERLAKLDYFRDEDLGHPCYHRSKVRVDSLIKEVAIKLQAEAVSPSSRIKAEASIWKIVEAELALDDRGKGSGSQSQS